MSARGTCGHLKPDTLVNQSSLVFPQGKLVHNIAGNKRKRTERKKLRGRRKLGEKTCRREIRPFGILKRNLFIKFTLDVF